MYVPSSNTWTSSAAGGYCLAPRKSVCSFSIKKRKRKNIESAPSLSNLALEQAAFLCGVVFVWYIIDILKRGGGKKHCIDRNVLSAVSVEKRNKSFREKKNFAKFTIIRQMGKRRKRVRFCTLTRTWYVHTHTHIHTEHNTILCGIMRQATEEKKDNVRFYCSK